MEKIFQILAVFVLLMLVITWSIRGREFKFREYSFLHRLRNRLSPEISERLLAAALVPIEGAPSVNDPGNGLIFRRGPDKMRALEIADERTGLVVVTLETGNVDAILFDPGTRLIYCCSALGTITIIRQLSRDEYRILQWLAAPLDSTVMALDTEDKKLYLESGGSIFVFAPS